MRIYRLSIVVIALSLCACAATPPSISGKFAEITQAQASMPEAVGQNVRWGGVVVGSRDSENGPCLEIAAFPLDTFHARPYVTTPSTNGFASLFRKGIENHPNGAFSDGNLPARYLACNVAKFDSSSGEQGAVLTLTGSIEPANLFEVDREACDYSARPALVQRKESLPNYAGTLHLVRDGHCFVSLPTLHAATLYAWKEPPQTTSGL